MRKALLSVFVSYFGLCLVGCGGPSNDFDADAAAEARDFERRKQEAIYEIEMGTIETYQEISDTYSDAFGSPKMSD